jgi:hypothetical protein
MHAGPRSVSLVRRAVADALCTHGLAASAAVIQGLAAECGTQRPVLAIPWLSASAESAMAAHRAPVQVRAASSGAVLARAASPCSLVRYNFAQAQASSDSSTGGAAEQGSSGRPLPELEAKLKPDHGPWRRYIDGLRRGKLKVDERQVVTMKLLQKLYVDLETLHPHPRKSKPSNLTVLDNVATDGKKGSWCDYFSKRVDMQYRS